MSPAPNVMTALVSARELLLSSWGGPQLESSPLGAARRDGCACLPSDEGAYRFSVCGALSLVTRTVDLGSAFAAWSVLMRIIDPPRWFEFEFWRGQGWHLPEYGPETKGLWLRARDLALAKKGPTIEEWLQNPMRTGHEIQRVFAQAIQRAKRENDNG